MSHRTTSLLAIAFLTASLLFGLAVHVSNPVLPDDDACITYRYADNLVSGHGLVYNPGQRVFGSSTPLYVVWLAGLRAVAGSVSTPEIAVRANFVFYALAILGVFFLLSSLVGSPTPAAFLTGLLALHPSLLATSLGGMETYLFTGLMVWSVWSVTARRFRLSAWLAGMSVLARPEGVLVIVAVFTCWAAARRNWRELLGLFAPSLVWVTFATSYFGTPIYHSIMAKSRPLYPMPAGSALGKLVSEVTLWTVGRSLRTADTSYLSVPILVLVLAAAVFGYVANAGHGLATTLEATGRFGPAVRCQKATKGSYATLAVPMLLVLFVGFYAVSNPLMFWWYYAPVECLWFVALASGMVYFSGWLRDHRRARLTYVPAIGLAVLIGGSTLSPLLARIAAHQRVTDLKLASSPDLERTMVYRAVAEWLNLVVPPGDTLVAPEIGALGYYYRGYIFDACGLVSPEAIPFLPVPANERNGPGAISLELVKHLNCDVVVTMQRFACRSLYPSDWFRENYERVRQFKPRLPLRFWTPGGDTVEVFFSRTGRATSLRR